MADQFLHGVEVVEIDTGARPVTTVRSSVIGVIGTAPDAQGLSKARLQMGSVSKKTALRWTAKQAGRDGNQISVRLRHPGAASMPLTISIRNQALTVSLASDAQGDLASTAKQIRDAVNAHVQASQLLDVALVNGSDGSGIMDTIPAAQFLSGGHDEAFPLNTPVLIAGSRLEAAALGDTGTLPAAVDGILDQAGAMIVVVRVAQGADPAETRSHIIGGVDASSGQYLGVHAFLAADSLLKVQPKILIAPGFTQSVPVVSELIGIAERLRAVIIADGPNTTDQAAISHRENFGSSRVYVVDPWVRVWDTTANAEALQPASARVAGMLARSDNDRGWWWSPSNTEMYGIAGPARAVDFAMGDVNARANYLNENEVATIIQKDGYRLWGNRTCSGDPKWAFLSVRRTADMINESLLRAHLWAVDRNISKTYIADVLEGVNSYLRHLTAINAILGGRCWAAPDLNTPDQISQGKVYFDFDFTPSYPAEHITFRSRLVNDYLEDVISTGGAA